MFTQLVSSKTYLCPHLIPKPLLSTPWPPKHWPSLKAQCKDLPSFCLIMPLANTITCSKLTANHYMSTSLTRGAC